MRSIPKCLALALASAGVLAWAPSRSGADMITYTETVVASGALDGSSFTDAAVTLTFVGDTSNVTSPSAGIFRNPIGTATVSVDGRTDTLTGPIEMFVTQADGTAGIETFARILTVQNSSLTDYDLTTPIGPLTGTSGTAAFGTNFATAGGSLAFSGMASTATFQASLAPAVPEPASLLMLGLGLAGMAAARLRSSSGGPKSAA